MQSFRIWICKEQILRFSQILLVCSEPNEKESKIKWSNLPFKLMRDQKLAEVHLGKTNVHLTFSDCIFWKHREIMLGGGTIQLLSYDHSKINASIPDVPGHQYFELNLLHFYCNHMKIYRCNVLPTFSLFKNININHPIIAI